MYKFNFFNSIWCIESTFALNYLPLVTGFLKNTDVGNAISYDPVPKQFQIAPKKGESYRLNDKWVRNIADVQENSIGILDISGAITKADRECESESGTNSYCNVLTNMYESQYITGIVLKISSGGGEGYAMYQMTETLQQRNKPVIAFIDDLAASAAFGIAAACDLIICNSSIAQVGSIGTYCTLVDYTKYFESLGINILEIYASKSTEKNKDFIEALKGNTELLKAKIDVFNDKFIASIKEGRADHNLGEEKLWGKGQMFFAPEAKELGLIDDIDTFENVLNYFT